MLKIFILTLLAISLIHARILEDKVNTDKEIIVDQGQVYKIELTDEVDYTFDYKVSENSSYGIDYAPFLFGSHNSSTSKGNPINLHIDTNLPYIALADAAPATGQGLNWGIDCTHSGSNCSLTTSAAAPCESFHAGWDNYKLFPFKNSTSSYSINYWENNTQCRTAQTFMRWTNNTLSKTSEFINKNIDVTLFETAPAIDASAGLLGLSPNGEFFKYVTAYTDWKSAKYVEFGLSLTPNSGAANLVDESKKDSWKSNQFVVHGKRNGGSIPFFNKISDMNSWFTNQTHVMIGDGSYTPWIVSDNQNLCVSTQYPKMLGFTSQNDNTLMQTYLAQVCDGVASPCNQKTMNQSKVSDIHVGFYNTTLPSDKNSQSYNLTLRKEDFLLLSGTEQDTPDHLVGDYLNLALENYGCPSTTNIVVGRAFLSRYEAVLKISSSTEMGLGFVANEGTSSVFLIILIILGCIILAICIAIILLKVCKRKSEDNEYNRQE